MTLEGTQQQADANAITFCGEVAGRMELVADDVKLAKKSGMTDSGRFRYILYCGENAVEVWMPGIDRDRVRLADRRGDDLPDEARIGIVQEATLMGWVDAVVMAVQQLQRED